MDYEKLQQEITQISEICGSVPEAFREKCFELLMQKLLSDPSLATASEEGGEGKNESRSTPDANVRTPNGSNSDSIPLQAQMRVLLAKTGVTAAQLQRILMMDDGQVHFIREPSASVIAAGQMDWALLLALKNGIENNKLEADPEAVRSICQEKGYYDKKNFASYFKKPKNATLFKGLLEPQGDPQGLTSDGIDALGGLVKSLAGEE